MTGLTVQFRRQLAAMKHGVTRFRITLLCYEAACVAGRARHKDQQLKWVSPAELEAYPLSVTGRKISRLVGR
jgi:A/G-specific adenine glycosylase